MDGYGGVDLYRRGIPHTNGAGDKKWFNLQLYDSTIFQTRVNLTYLYRQLVAKTFTRVVFVCVCVGGGDMRTRFGGGVRTNTEMYP